MGAAAILRQHPHDAAPLKKRSLIPLVHAASRAAWLAFRDAYRAFVAAYAVARNRLRAGVKTVAFPGGIIPAARAFRALCAGLRTLAKNAAPPAGQIHDPE